MQAVSVETLSPLMRRLSITLPWSALEAAELKELESYRKKAKINGFRPGKAPLSIVKMQANVRPQVIYDLMREHVKPTLDAFLEQSKSGGEDLSLAGHPQYDVPKINEGDSLELNYQVELLPTITLPELAEIEVSQLEAQVTPEDVEKTIERLQKQFQTWESVERPAVLGDRVSIDFEGMIDGELFNGGSATDFELELGSEKMIPGFESGLLGVQTGETRTLTLTFPADYHNAEMADKTAEFKVTVHGVDAPHLPALDEALLKKMGIQNQTLEAFRAELTQSMGHELKLALREASKSAVFTAISEKVNFELPQVLIEEQTQSMLENMEKRFKMKLDPTKLAPLFAEPASKRVKLGLLVRELIKHFDIKAEQSMIQSLLEEKTAVFENENEMLDTYAKDSGFMSSLENEAIELALLEKLLASLKVTVEPTDFFTVMEKAQRG